MAPFRDWPATLRPASYRGVSFYVSTDEIETGRRLDVHEFPHADDAYVEDLGRKANTVQVTAYLVSDLADVEQLALRRACDAGGAALLSLPMERLHAHCETCRRSFNKDKLGYVAFDLTFVREGRSAGLLPAGFLAAVVSSLAEDLESAVADSFDADYEGQGVPGFVHDQAAEDLMTAAALVEDLIATARLREGRAAPLAAAASTVFSTAGVAVKAGAASPILTQTSFVGAVAGSSGTGTLSRSLFSLARAAGNATIGTDGVRALGPLLTFNADLRPATGWQATAAANSAAIGRAVRAGALFGLAERIAQTRYDERRDAIQARADVAELAEFERNRLDAGRDHRLARAIGDIAGRTADYLSRQIADIAPIVTVEAPRRMPSLWWSQRLYGTAARAGELAQRNGVKHAGFMPAAFEAKAL